MHFIRYFRKADKTATVWAYTNGRMRVEFKQRQPDDSVIRESQEYDSYAHVVEFMDKHGYIMAEGTVK